MGRYQWGSDRGRSRDQFPVAKGRCRSRSLLLSPKELKDDLHT